MTLECKSKSVLSEKGSRLRTPALKKSLINTATLLSFGLMLATLALWCRSYSTIDFADVTAHRQQAYSLTSADGAIDLQNVKFGRVAPTWHLADLRWNFDFNSTMPLKGWLDSYHGFAGFKVNHVLGNRTMDPGEVVWVKDDAICFPDWSLALVFVLLPGRWAYQRIWILEPDNKCRKCGYDLRATPDRCPECGTIRNESAVATQ